MVTAAGPNREGDVVVPTFLHVGKTLLQLVVDLRTEGKVIHEYNTAGRESHVSVQLTSRNSLARII